jgi:hypothetical protein
MVVDPDSESGSRGKKNEEKNALFKVKVKTYSR